MSTHDSTKTTPPYLPGERVRVTFTATIAGTDDDGTVRAQLDGFNGGYHFIVPAEARLERERPAEGEPAPGELWRDRKGTDWFVGVSGRMSNRLGTDLPWTMVNADCGPLTRIYQPGPAAFLDDDEDVADRHDEPNPRRFGAP